MIEQTHGPGKSYPVGVTILDLSEMLRDAETAVKWFE